MSLREQKKRETRQRILEAARVLFRTKGFDETHVREIARTVQISEPTFYNYFADKEVVLDALALDWLSRASETLAQAGSRKSTVQLLRDYLMAQCDAMLADRSFATLVITRSSVFTFGRLRDDRAVGNVRRASRGAFEVLAQVIRTGQEHGELRAEIDALNAAEVLHGALTLVMRLWLTGYWKTRVGLKRKVSQSLDLLLEGMLTR